jgi:hypothetical protein
MWRLSRGGHGTYFLSKWRKFEMKDEDRYRIDRSEADRYQMMDRWMDGWMDGWMNE